MLEGVIAHPLVLRARVRASFWRARVSQPSAARYCRRFEKYACAGKTFRSSSTIVENGRDVLEPLWPGKRADADSRLSGPVLSRGWDDTLGRGSRPLGGL